MSDIWQHSNSNFMFDVSNSSQLRNSDYHSAQMTDPGFLRTIRLQIQRVTGFLWPWKKLPGTLAPSPKSTSPLPPSPTHLSPRSAIKIICRYSGCSLICKFQRVALVILRRRSYALHDAVKTLFNVTLLWEGREPSASGHPGCNIADKWLWTVFNTGSN